MPNRSGAARLVAAFATVVAVSAAQQANPQDRPAAHVRNFGKVNQYVFRGGEPSLVGLQELGAMGVKLDIDLRETSSVTEFEQQEAQKLGIKYVNVPFPPLSAPTQAEVQRVLGMLQSTGSNSVFVHCRRGADRTGTVIACYRIQHDGWTSGQALSEAKKYGMSFTERAMKSFILHFVPQPIQPIQGAVGQVF